ncbi:hypothetical protein C8A03DRAFT_16341 [Achaetomium macrosporum]|uniref:F-box domain-containing protein n=1 Tax=Achaetomium macrosporum TaxID=79813 RepID=A0AAN7H6B1_9PEZI|nr:hypothetical protein C8A03DRAFT_16341 [Achaetomium macrosporum]
MALVSLPAELLLPILDDLGPRFFHQNVRRLTISKRWYALAWPVFARELILTSASLARFVSDEAVFRRMEPHIASARLSIGGKKLRFKPGDLGAVYVARKDKLSKTDSTRLRKVATKLQQCPALRSLRLNFTLDSPNTQLPFADLVGLRHLTSLEIDAILLPAVPRGTTTDDCWCCHINRLLCSLRRLRCRISPACRRLLEIDRAVGSGLPVGLEELIINLDCRTTLDWMPRSCRYMPYGPYPPGSGFTHFDGIKTQAAALALHMTRPRMVRVIEYDCQAREIRAFDALTGRQSRLPRDYEWDAEGELIEDDGQRGARQQRLLQYIWSLVS